MQARIARRPTPTSEIDAEFPFSAISRAIRRTWLAVSITRSGISAAYLLANCIALERAAFSSAESFGNAKCCHHFVEGSRVFIDQEEQFVLQLLPLHRPFAEIVEPVIPAALSRRRD